MRPYGSRWVRGARLTLLPPSPPPIPLQRLRSQSAGHAAAFAALQEELRRARAVNERMERGHGEGDADLQRFGQRVEALLRRWDAALAQMELRLRDLQLLGRRLRCYRQSCDALQEWIRDARLRQDGIQAVPVGDSAAVREQLLQQKVMHAVQVGVGGAGGGGGAAVRAVCGPGAALQGVQCAAPVLSCIAYV